MRAAKSAQIFGSVGAAKSARVDVVDLDEVRATAAALTFLVDEFALATGAAKNERAVSRRYAAMCLRTGNWARHFSERIMPLQEVVQNVSEHGGPTRLGKLRR
jgi:hypothetical protein